MLTSLHLHEKRRELCINARSPSASLPFKGQVTEKTTVKGLLLQVLFYFFRLPSQVSALYGLNRTGQGRGLLKWDYDGET